MHAVHLQKACPSALAIAQSLRYMINVNWVIDRQSAIAIGKVRQQEIEDLYMSLQNVSL